MSALKSGTDYVGTDIYNRHLRGDAAQFNNLPTVNREALHQRMHMRILTELAANRFEWKNLPDEIDARFVELQLFYRALVLFWKHPVNGFLFATRGTPYGQYDIADNPTMFQANGVGLVGNHIFNAARTYSEIINGDDMEVKNPDCVPVWANFLRVPDLDVVMLYATKLASLDVTIEINSKNARRSKVLVVDENQQLSAANISREIDAGNNNIKLGSGAAMGLVPTAIDLGIDVNAIEKLHILKVRQWNEAMGLLGINNANQDKKERLVADEVDANNAQVAASRNVALNERRNAAKLINKLFGTKIEVNYNEEVEAEAAEKAPKLEAVPKTEEVA